MVSNLSYDLIIIIFFKFSNDAVKSMKFISKAYQINGNNNSFIKSHYKSKPTLNVVDSPKISLIHNIFAHIIVFLYHVNAALIYTHHSLHRRALYERSTVLWNESFLSHSHHLRTTFALKLFSWRCNYKHFIPVSF